MKRKFFFVVILLEGITFWFAALLHSGANVLFFIEPQIIPAMIVEGLCGFFLLISAALVFTHKKVARKIAVAAHIFSIAGVVLGIVALTLGRGPTTILNYFYHRVILTVLLVMLIVLFSARARAALDTSS